MRIRIGHLAAAVLAIGSAAYAQSPSTSTTGEVPPSPTLTPAVPATAPPPIPYAATQPVAAPAPPPAVPLKTPATQPSATVAGSRAVTGQLGNVVVTSDLDQARDQIAPPLGANTYTIGPNQILVTPQGQNATFQQVLLRSPGVV